MGFLDPYAIDGATATAAQQRRVNYKTCQGRTGIDHATDLRVVAVDGSPGVAGIIPGGGNIAVESRQEAYGITNTAMDGNALLDVPAAGSSGATHYVIVSVTDPEFHGQEPATVPQLVSSLSGRTRPYLSLARIDLEAGESFDATSSITDLREISVPRIERRLFAYNLPSDSQSVLTNDDTQWGQGFPNFLRQPGEGYPWMIDIPTWATHAQAIGTWSGVRVAPVTGRWGRIWVRIGWLPDQSEYSGAGMNFNRVDWNLDDMGGGIQREFWSSGDERNVPASLRGTTQPVMLRGARHAVGSGGIEGSGPRLNNWSAVFADIQFTEGPA